jgi:hypothetical protein
VTGAIAPVAATATPAPVPSPTPAIGPTQPPTLDPLRPRVVRVSGRVFDAEGRPVDGATVRVRTRDGEPSYDETVPTEAGAWEVADAPDGVLLELSATRAGWTTRRRFGATTDMSMRPAVIHFGAPPDVVPWDEDPTGAPFFLSELPEVGSVAPAGGPLRFDPADGAWLADIALLDLALAFSGPFDEPTRRRLAAAVRLWPADASHDGPAAVGVGPGSRVRATWDAAGNTLTFAINGAVTRSGAYELGLVSDGGPYLDADGHALGSAPAAAGQLVPHAFALSDGELFRLWQGSGKPPSGSRERWLATHSTAFAFATKK